ncbi:MAG: adenosylcobinamide-GDP ribazoletransferase [Magnetococcales bacterium]|nr:adenosylcobinamide-GDP ribazoletransferase [Magnetococcales bacterium]
MKRSFFIALGLLTRIPIPREKIPPTPREMGASVPLYPLVGLLLGGILGSFSSLWPGSMADTGAFLVLLFWVLLTGGLHLDGLADTADAWVGGMGSREKTLAIMTDPRSGPVAVVAVALVLLGKFAAIRSLILTGAPGLAIGVALLLARLNLLLLMLTLPYVRPGGMAAQATAALPKRSGWFMAVVTLLAVISLKNSSGFLALTAGVGLFLVLGWRFRQRLGGVTGDTLGAACEITELGTLLTWAIAAVPPG